MIESTCERFQQWKDKGTPVKYARCDNAGEKRKLEARCKSNG